MKLQACALLIAAALMAGPAHAEPPLQPNDTVVTGFSGVSVPDIEFAPGVNPIDESFIRTDGASAQVYRFFPEEPPQGQLIQPQIVFDVKARDVGQVFAATFDDAEVPNFYLGATSAFGLNIVTPDADGDGRPERAKTGAANAQWMEGQFGQSGGPGSIYKVDGKTGAPVLFATVGTNSGPGLGDVVFDKASRQFFVSDLDTGLIHRLSADGSAIDTFDHGTAGRTAAGLDPVADDGIVMLIQNPGFNAEDPATWGFTANERRIGGMAVRDERLYYAAGPEVWSVGIAPDGAFAGDARREIEASSLPTPSAIADITFDESGNIYLSQRGDQRASYNYSVFAEAGKSSALRFARDPNDPSKWQSEPGSYAVGFEPDHREATGGIDVGANPSTGACDMAFISGNRLSRLGTDPEAQIVQGLQGTEIGATRTGDTIPTENLFVDYDQAFADPTASGHAGDVETWRGCDSAKGGKAAYFPPGFEIEEPWFEVEYPDLQIDKIPLGPCLEAGDSYDCFYSVQVTNIGSGVYTGPVSVLDHSPFPFGKLTPTLPWFCAGVNTNLLHCALPSVMLPPGASVSLDVKLNAKKVAVGKLCEMPNKARMLYPAGDSVWTSAPIPNPNCDQFWPFPKPLFLTKKSDGPCTIQPGGDWDCPYTVTVKNNGFLPYAGPITVRDRSINYVNGMVSGAGPWVCAPNPGTPQIDCLRNGPPLMPGASTNLKVKIRIKAGNLDNNMCHVVNRAKLLAPNGNAFVAVSALQHPGCAAPDQPVLKLKKTLNAPCALAAGKYTCNYTVKISNVTANHFAGTVKIDDQTPFAKAELSGPGAPWVCAGTGTQNLSCTRNAMAIPAFTNMLLNYKLVIKQADIVGPKCDVLNTATLMTPAGNASQALTALNDPACSPPAPDLKITKDATGPCVKVGNLYECPFKIGVKNHGAGLYLGQMRFLDKTTVAGATVSSGNPICVPGPQQLDCTAPFVALPPLGQAVLSVKVKVDEDEALAAACDIKNGVKLLTPAGNVANASAPVLGVCLAQQQQQQECPPGLKFMVNKCVSDDVAPTPPKPEPKACPKGQVGTPPNCRTPDVAPQPEPECPAGFVGTPPNCRRIVIDEPRPVCPPGFVGRPPNCERIVIDPPKCRPGFVGTPPNCRPIVIEPKRCPKGFTGTPPNCTRIVIDPPKCRPGFVGTPPNCRPLVIEPQTEPKRCPRGFIGVPPNCRPRLDVQPQGNQPPVIR